MFPAASVSSSRSLEEEEEEEEGRASDHGAVRQTPGEAVFSPRPQTHAANKHTDSACWGPAESTGGSKRPRREWCFGKTDAKCGGLRNRGSIWPRSQPNTLLTNILEIVSASVIAVCILIYIVHLLYGQWGKVAARFRPQAADV